MVIGTVCLAALACAQNRMRAVQPRIVVLGFDGMDYRLARQLMAAGRMPNFSRLAERGGFSALQTSLPPQSPVAWSDFITGRDSGHHGIFDFVHRDPASLEPYLSTSRVEPPRYQVRLFGWQLPLSPARVSLLRTGTPFWAAPEARGLETTIVRMPANFPPSGTATRELTGMGTPDLLGTYGTFSFYTSRIGAATRPLGGGGRQYRFRLREGAAEGTLHGPPNPYRADGAPVTREFTVFLDPDRSAVKLVAGDSRVVLTQGEWSEWTPIEFPLALGTMVRGMCRFYLKEVRPFIDLYVSPINLDPLDAALPISAPPDFARQLAEATGRFYTQGMPEDTAALTEGVLTAAEFLEQARLAATEVKTQYWHVLTRHQAGLLFYYFGNLDQVSHMMWRPMDRSHPAYLAERDAPFEEVVPRLYEEFDDLVGRTLERITPETLLVVMSDHGFTSWRRAFNLNTWLAGNGYLVAASGRSGRTAAAGPGEPGSLGQIDWARTRAYALGLNGLYLNLRGRERDGIVASEARQALLDELSVRLESVVDPETGEKPVRRVLRRDEAYREHDHDRLGPDLIVGYAEGYRSSNESAIGGTPPGILADNTSEWSGDHCIDPEVVPGILLVNRPLAQPAPDLRSLSQALLAEMRRDGR